MKPFTMFILALLAAMLGGIAYAVVHGDFWAELNDIIARPWGQATLLDLYVGFAFIGLWIFWREANPVRATMCFLPTLFLGNLYVCVYILYAIFSSGGDKRVLMNGKRADKQL